MNNFDYIDSVKNISQSIQYPKSIKDIDDEDEELNFNELVETNRENNKKRHSDEAKRRLKVQKTRREIENIDPAMKKKIDDYNRKGIEKLRKQEEEEKEREKNGNIKTIEYSKSNRQQIGKKKKTKKISKKSNKSSEKIDEIMIDKVNNNDKNNIKNNVSPIDNCMMYSEKIWDFVPGNDYDIQKYMIMKIGADINMTIQDERNPEVKIFTPKNIEKPILCIGGINHQCNTERWKLNVKRLINTCSDTKCLGKYCIEVDRTGKFDAKIFKQLIPEKCEIIDKGAIELRIIGKLNEYFCYLPEDESCIEFRYDEDGIYYRIIPYIDLKSIMNREIFTIKIIDNISSKEEKINLWEYYRDSGSKNESFNIDFLPYSSFIKDNQHTNTCNLFRGFYIKSNPKFELNQDYIQPILDYIKNFLSDDSEEKYIQIINWLRHIIQSPQQRPNIALIFKYQNKLWEKDVFLDFLIKKIYYPHSGFREIFDFSDQQSNLRIGPFGNFISNRLLVMMDDSSINPKDNKESQNIYKSFDKILTQTYCEVKKDKRDQLQISNFTRYIINTNRNYAFDESKYIVCNIDSKKILDEIQKQKLITCMKDHSEDFFHFLLHGELKGFEPKSQVVSIAIQNSMEIPVITQVVEKVVKEKIRSNEILFLEDLFLRTCPNSLYKTKEKTKELENINLSDLFKNRIKIVILYKCYKIWCEKKSMRNIMKKTDFTKFMIKLFNQEIKTRMMDEKKACGWALEFPEKTKALEILEAYSEE